MMLDVTYGIGYSEVEQTKLEKVFGLIDERTKVNELKVFGRKISNQLLYILKDVLNTGEYGIVEISDGGLLKKINDKHRKVKRKTDEGTGFELKRNHLKTIMGFFEEVGLIKSCGKSEKSSYIKRYHFTGDFDTSMFKDINLNNYKNYFTRENIFRKIDTIIKKVKEKAKALIEYRKKLSEIVVNKREKLFGKANVETYDRAKEEINKDELIKSFSGNVYGSSQYDFAKSNQPKAVKTSNKHTSNFKGRTQQHSNEEMYDNDRW